jgi:mRNA interferase RelE/StbE
VRSGRPPPERTGGAGLWDRAVLARPMRAGGRRRTRGRTLEADASALVRSDRAPPTAAIDLLADDPRPPACRKLKGEDNAYRVRVGDYRIVYEILDDRLVIHVVQIGHRRDVYRS